MQNRGFYKMVRDQSPGHSAGALGTDRRRGEKQQVLQPHTPPSGVRPAFQATGLWSLSLMPLYHMPWKLAAGEAQVAHGVIRCILLYTLMFIIHKLNECNWGGQPQHFQGLFLTWRGQAAVIFAPPPQDLNVFCFLLFLGSSWTPQFSAWQLQCTSCGPALVKAPSGLLCICAVTTSPHPGPGRRVPSQGWVLISIHPFLVVHCLYMVEEYFKPLFKSLYGFVLVFSHLIQVGILVLIKTIPPHPLGQITDS